MRGVDYRNVVKKKLKLHCWFYSLAFTCIPFPGPGITSPMSENLFFEFFGAPGYKDVHKTARVDSEFESFKVKHRKEYGNRMEEGQRKGHFAHNYR